MPNKMNLTKMSKLKAGLIYTRFGKTDGVSLQSLELRKALARKGFQLHTLSGEAPSDLPRTTILPLMNLTHPLIQKISKDAFGEQRQVNNFRITAEIEKAAQELQGAIFAYLYKHQFDLLIVFNALTIPMNLPLGLALERLLETLPIPKILRHYDFYWERERFQNSQVEQILDLAFPPKDSSAQTVHLVLNTLQKQFLKKKYGLESYVLPDTFDYQSKLNQRDHFNVSFRKDLGLHHREIIFLQPSRLIPRKKIEHTIELIKRLNLPNTVLLLTGYAGDEGMEYPRFLKQKIKKAKIKAIWASGRIGFERSMIDSQKIYTLWDAYVNSDFVCLPSAIEGFGNHVVEALYFRKPLFVNNYPVFRSDIAPKGVQAVTINGQVTQGAVNQIKALFESPGRILKMTDHNYQVGQKYFSEKTLQKVLDQVLTKLNFPPS